MKNLLTSIFYYRFSNLIANFKLKIFTILILIFFFSKNIWSQTLKFEYHDYELIESFEIKKDSFHFKGSIGLIYNNVKGRIEIQNDTLILNSNLQPDYVLKKTLNNSIEKNKVEIQVQGLNLFTNYGFRIYDKRGKDKDIDLHNEKTTRVDSISKSTIHSFNKKLLTRKNKRFVFILYGTNLEINLSNKNIKNNQIQIHFNSQPNDIDYEFFTNRKAIIKDNDFILLDKNGDPEKTRYVISKKGKIIISKKKRIKKYTKNNQE